MFKNCQGMGIKFKIRIPQFYIPIKNYFVHSQHLPELIYEVSLKTKIEIKSHLLFIILSLFLSSFSCKEDPLIPKPEAKLTLAVEDVSCTEAWLNLKLENVTLPVSVELKNDSVVTKTFLAITATDTTLYVDSLLPNQTYKFQSVIQSINHSSNEVSVATMDTTSHNFTFTTFEFGTIGSSVLYDVAIINENNIWAVGEINIADTSVNGYTMYNAVHWDGNEWQLKRITVNFRGVIITPTLEGVFAFSPTQIWLAGGLTIFGDGTNWIPYDVRLITGIDALTTSKAWGSSADNMYFVGRNGNIAHYNGSQWRRIESGTTLNINDIWGDYNNKTGEWEILAVASNILHSLDKEVIKVSINATEILDKVGIDETLSSVWFKTGRNYYVAGSGIYEKSNLISELWNGDPLDITNYFIYKLRGKNLNDIAAVGGVGEILHFNGFSWKSFFDEAGLNFGNYYSVDIKNDLIVVVGVEAPRAAITLGRRIN